MYYIEKDNKIVLTDENFETLQFSKQLYPDYSDLEIKEVEEGYTIYDLELMTVEEKEAREGQKEREKLDSLSMRRGDVFEALILAKGLGKAQIRTMIEQAELDDITKALYLNRFDEALDFYRGYPIFNLLCETLDITPKMLDKFFETKDYKYLTTCTLTINPIPINATVIINDIEQTQCTVPYKSQVSAQIYSDGYKTHYVEISELTENKVLDIKLEEEIDTPDENIE